MPIQGDIALGLQPQNPMGGVQALAMGQQMADNASLEQERQQKVRQEQQAAQQQAQIHQIISSSVNPATGNLNTALAAMRLRSIGAEDQAEKVEEYAQKTADAASKQVDEEAKQRTAARKDLSEQAQTLLDIDASGRPVPPSAYQALVTNVAKTLGPQVASSMPTQFDRAFVTQGVQWGQSQDERDKHISSLAELATKRATTDKEQMALAFQMLGDPTHSVQDNAALLGAMEHGGQLSAQNAALLAGKSGQQIQQLRLTPEQQANAGDMKRQPAMVGGQLVDVLVDKAGNAYDAKTRQPVDAKPVPSQAMVNLQMGGAQGGAADVTAARPDPATANKVDPSTGLTPNAVYQHAVVNALEGKMPQMGFGSTPQARNVRTAILNKAAALADAAGTDLGTLQQEYKANSSALNKLTSLYNATAASAGTANDNLALASEQSANVPRTGSPLVNRYSQWALGHQLTGNPELTKLETYIYTAAREYAKVTSGAAGSVQGLTDSGAKAADQLLNAAQTPEAFQAAIGAMQKDMQNVTKNQVQRIGAVSGTVAKFLAKANGQPEPTGGGDGGTTSQAYTGERRQAADGRILGKVGDKVVELTQKSDGSWVVK